MERFEDKSIEEKIEIINDEKLIHQNFESWNSGLFVKFLILLPLIVFILGLYFLSPPGNIVELLFIFLYSIILILAGIIIFFLMGYFKK